MVRGSLGRTIDLEASSDLETSYPFYGISVPDFLELKQWHPHQDLVASGKVVQMTEADEVLFVSHQWTSFDHPDPANDQLEALQTQIKTLMRGKCDVRSNFMLEAVYQYPMLISGKEWAKKLPQMYLWVDYMSIPQPGALVPEASEDLVQELDSNGDGIVSADELLHHAGHTTERRASADHRLATATDKRIAELVEQLKAAVSSIPSYIERSSMMWVLVPPVQHQNLSETICDFSSWRRRGWCRMEFAASKLACGDDMPLMVIKSATEPPEFFNPCDMFKLCAARGEFTVEADKREVNRTLTKMLEAKAASFERRNKDVTLMRLIKVFGPVFVPREAYGSKVPASAASTAAASAAASAAAELPELTDESAVARLRRFFGWRSEAEESAWVAETGWNLLTLAAAMDDVDAVDELLANPDAAAVKALLDAVGKKMVVAGNDRKGGPLHRREPLGQKLLQYAEGMSPLMAAMTFAQPQIVAKLMDAGADVERDGLKLLGERPCTFRGAAIAGKAANVELLLERYPQYVNAVNAFGACPLHFAAMTSKCLGQKAVVERLLEAGAQPSVTDAQNLFSGSVLGTACATYDQDPEAIRMLLEAGADPSRPEVLLPKVKVLRRLSGVFRALGNTQMRGLNRILVSLPGRFKQTPAHVAARRGDVELVKVLAEHEQFVRAVSTCDTRGETPVMLAESTWGAQVKESMTRAIEASCPDALLRQPAAAAPAAAAAPRKKPFFSRSGRSKYRVAPGVAAEVDPDADAAAEEATWREAAVREAAIASASPLMQRAAAPMAAAA